MLGVLVLAVLMAVAGVVVALVVVDRGADDGGDPGAPLVGRVADERRDPGGPGREALGVVAARGLQDGSTATVRGHVVGQPVAPGTLVTDGFPDDLALALAAEPGVTAVDEVLLVQVPAGAREAWGLRSNPGLLGREVVVTGTLAPYFGAPGLRAATSFALVDGEDAGEDPGEDAGEGPGDYYAAAEGLRGAALEAALHEVVSTGVRELSYDEVWAALADLDADPADPSRVLLLYTGASVPAGDRGGGPDQWNREHVWAQSHGDLGTSPGPGTDLHHLRPADVTVNAARAALDFDEGGTEVEEAPGNRADGDSWEPRDEVKGDVARMVLYMSVRYEGGDGYADLEVVDRVGTGSTPFHGRLSVLLRWHAEDPPDAAERARNDAVHRVWQGNRNPFVDHPEWAAAIW